MLIVCGGVFQSGVIGAIWIMDVLPGPLRGLVCIPALGLSLGLITWLSFGVWSKERYQSPSINFWRLPADTGLASGVIGLWLQTHIGKTVGGVRVVACRPVKHTKSGRLRFHYLVGVTGDE